MIILIFAALVRYFRSFPVSMVGQGQNTAPSLMHAMAKIHHSGTRVSRMITLSPLLIPYFSSMFAAWLERFINWRKVKFFSSPFWFTQIIASLFRSFFASASITSKPKL